ncbi:helix-turn-helix transcriptional regulator [Polynucleobacter sp. MWH-UH35A]|uniref:helix-turn-helix domain-containing protein n=1 Tax=Polynucleobacter sp. MWH-UH35A TaxID=1855619 RepID=UPI001BFE0D1A|nr:helix-turn-helix transcriptional regulator [Polynucleobacter sp. MWH-UH35A]QWD59360.1 helix-turn-helix transcriptional regulator [Polynucleobacter sp. MWH-UH35A]
MTKISTLHKRWLKEPTYKKAYEESQIEFEIAKEIIEARTKSGLSQEELAALMDTSQSAIARLESGACLPSMRTLAKFAKATNSQIQIHFKQIKPIKHKAAA